MLINSRGQTLIEAIISLSAAVVIISAIVISVISSVNNTDYSKDQAKASRLAQSELESLISLSKSDLTKFSSYNAEYCAGEGGELIGDISNCAISNVDKFIRTVKFVTPVFPYDGDCGSNTIVEVTVKWTDGRCGKDIDSNPIYCHKIVNSACIAKENPVPTI